jgi:ribosome-binding factor A
LRAAELVRHALVEVLAHEDLRDPALVGVSVTVGEVRMSPDLKHAVVFVSDLGRHHEDDVAKGLNRSAKFLRGRLAKVIELKFTPDLKFIADRSYDEAERMNALFRQPGVARDLGKGEA